ncbi:MAG: erythromycin esterase family protein [Pseudomonadota bacterium]
MLNQREQDRFIAWAREHALMLPSLAPNDDITDLLAPICTGKRFAFLGEADHFIAEKVPARLMILNSLAALGFKTFAEELSRSEGRRVARYLSTGYEDWLERLTTLGYQGNSHTDRDDSPTGILKDSFARGVDPGFRATQLGFYRGLQAFTDIEFAGFDVDYSPGAGYEDVRTLLIAEGANELTTALAAVPGETLEQEIVRLEGLHRQLTTSTLSAETLAQLEPILKTLIDGYRYIALAHPASDYASLAPAMAFRETVMHRHVTEIEAHSDSCIVLMAHDLHLARNDFQIYSPEGVGPGGDTARSTGHFVNEHWPEQVTSIWMLHEFGQDSQPLPGLPCELQASKDSLNALLGQVGECFLLPVSSEAPEADPLRQEMPIYHLYNIHFRARIAEQVDFILFIREVSALKDNI